MTIDERVKSHLRKLTYKLTHSLIVPHPLLCTVRLTSMRWASLRKFTMHWTLDINIARVRARHVRKNRAVFRIWLFPNGFPFTLCDARDQQLACSVYACSVSSSSELTSCDARDQLACSVYACSVSSSSELTSCDARDQLVVRCFWRCMCVCVYVHTCVRSWVEGEKCEPVCGTWMCMCLCVHLCTCIAYDPQFAATVGGCMDTCVKATLRIHNKFASNIFIFVLG